MKRLISDASKLDSSVDANSTSFGNLVKAIHAVQDNMGITGTTEKEAAGTISGSLASMKSAWGNLLPALIQGGDSFDQCVDNLVESVGIFAKNVKPAITKALSGVGSLIEELTPIIVAEIPTLVNDLLPPLIKAATAIVQGLIKALPSIFSALAKEMPGIVKMLSDAIVETFGDQFPALKEFAGFISDNAKSIGQAVGKMLPAVAGLIVAFKAIKFISSIFGGSGKGGFFDGLLKSLKNLAKTKTATILKGMANLAIILGGFTLLTAVCVAILALVSKITDFKQMLQMVAIMGALGLVAGVLTKFAGLVGLIPIPVVLTGLANMALVLGGVSLLILAFGALSKIKGFTTFIESGGKLLAKIFGVIGEVVGSLIGGVAAGITNSLPKIGENLSAFAKSIEPMFASFANADMSGIGTFLGAFGKFVLLMAGEKILSFFTGKTDYAELGTQLTAFAEGAKGFFVTVAELPEKGFSKATQLFDCLAGLKSLPKEGGVVGWFKGNVNYTTLADGLKQLGSDKVKGFFEAVSTLKQTAFDNATALFDCLAGLKSLPKDGGVVGWFSGDINYSNIATGLKQLGSDGVKKFFTMTGSLKQKAFDNVKLLFESLAGIGDLPKEGGWWQKLTGDKSTALGNIATEIENFSTKSEAFFKQVNGLNLGNLNGLWDSLQKSEDVTANVSKVIDDKISEIVKKITELPEKMGDGLRQGGRSLSEALVEVWTDAVKASVKPVNKVLDAANWILKEFGSEKRVISWTPYAKGTSGHKGGNALVNDGRGAELLQMPNGRMFIPNGRNVFLPNAPKGMKVLPAEQTARLMGRKSPTHHYASGIGDIDLWSYIDNSSGLASKIASSVSYSGMSGFTRNVGSSMVSTFTGAMSGWIDKLFEEFGAKGLADYVASAGVEQWRTTVARALKMEGQYNAANVERTLYQMQTESGGNPKAINLWDRNAKNGVPSKGLMQVIDPTFAAYARPGYDKNIYDPLSNILASVRYATSRYGSLSKAYRGVGYSNGVGEVTMPSSSEKVTYSPESDSRYYTTNKVENNTYAPQFTLHITGTNDDRAMARKVKQWVREAMDDVFDSMERKTVRLQEV